MNGDLIFVGGMVWGAILLMLGYFVGGLIIGRRK